MSTDPPQLLPPLPLPGPHLRVWLLPFEVAQIGGEAQTRTALPGCSPTPRLQQPSASVTGEAAGEAAQVIAVPQWKRHQMPVAQRLLQIPRASAVDPAHEALATPKRVPSLTPPRRLQTACAFAVGLSAADAAVHEAEAARTTKKRKPTKRATTTTT